MELITITDEQMETHAQAAASRGALWLDTRKPGWAKDESLVLPIRPEYFGEDEEQFETSKLLGQLRLAPVMTQALRNLMTARQDIAEKIGKQVETFFAAQEGDTLYTPIFTDAQHAEGAGIVANLIGMPVPEQEYHAARATQIDLAYYGFATFWMVLAFGSLSGTKPTEAQMKAKGYDWKTAGTMLAEAWTAQIEERR